MPKEIVKLEPLNSLKGLFIALVIGTLILGFIITESIRNQTIGFLGIIVYLITAPLAISLGGFFLGWAGKKRVEYSQPEWEFEPVQFESNELKKIGKEYLRKYRRLAPRSEFWMWFLPVLLVLFLVGSLFYGSFSSTGMDRFLLIGAAILHPMLLAASTYVGFLGISNEASEDFKLPLIKEVIWLADTQDNLPGFHDVRVVLDKAEHNGFEIYRSPRVFARVKYVDNDGYVESWTGELRSVDRVHARLHLSNENSVFLYWRSMDRQFRKSPGPDSYGHYVSDPPFRRSELGVKDVETVLTAAEILLLREWIELQEGHTEAERFLTKLNYEKGNKFDEKAS